MPLVRIDALEGRSPEQIATLLDAVHRALVTAVRRCIFRSAIVTLGLHHVLRQRLHGDQS